MNNIPLYKEKDFKNVQRLFILLGPACNMSCRHCHQTPEKNQFCVPVKAIHCNVQEIIDNFVDYIQYTNKKGYIHLWGGEPLLYWKTIKDIVVNSFLRKTISLEKMQFSITTNGLLIDEEKVAFLNKYNFHVYFSYDAPHPFAVRGYVSKEKCDLISKINDLTIISNESAYNYDRLLAYRCIKAKFPNAKAFIGFGLIRSFDMPKDIYNYQWDCVADSYKRMRIASQLGDRFATNFLYKNFMSKIQGYMENALRENFSYKKSCVATENSLSISLDGMVYACHNCSEKIGFIRDSLSAIRKNAHLFMTEKMSYSGCQYCRHKDICDGHCFLHIRNTDGKYLACDDYFIPLYDIVKKELLKLLNPLSNEDKNWYYEQDKLLNLSIQQFLSL